MQLSPLGILNAYETDRISQHNYSAEKEDAVASTAPQAWSADFVENKGDGRIFLLHGPPGVGKTYVSDPIQPRIKIPGISSDKFTNTSHRQPVCTLIINLGLLNVWHH